MPGILITYPLYHSKCSLSEAPAHESPQTETFSAMISPLRLIPVIGFQLSCRLHDLLFFR